MIRRSSPIRSAEQLGRALARLRREGGLTQAELGRLAGLRQATISSVESGAPGTEVSTVFAILAVLGAQIVLEGRTFGPPTVVGRHGD